MTELRIKLKKILTDLEYSHDYLFTHDEIPNIIDKIEEAIYVTRCCESDSEQLLFSDDEIVSICLERAKKYARHQHFLGTQGKDLVEFEDWQAKD